MGAFNHDYRESMIRDEDNLPRLMITGTGVAMASNRVSHFFDLKGASMTLDTGCSTGLVALHQAVQSLRSGESDMSVVGSSNLMLNPDMFKALGSIRSVTGRFCHVPSTRQNMLTADKCAISRWQILLV